MTLRFVSFLAPSIKPLYHFIAERVSARLGLQTELLVGNSYAQALDGRMDFGFICGLAYVVLDREHPDLMRPIAAPILRGERYRSQPIYFSDVIVHRESPVQAFEDLRGRSWAFNEPLSQSGYGIMREKLLEIGETGGFFGQVVEAGFHQRSIRMVQRREVEAAAIDSQVLEVELRDHPELVGELRVIDSLGPSTIQPVVAASSLPESLVADVRQVLTELVEEPGAAEMLELGLVERFTPVGAANYDDIRQMLQAAEHAGFMTVR